MKYKVLLMLVLLMPIQVFANNLIEVDFDCYHERDNKYICEVWGNSNEIIQAIDFKVSLPSYISTSEFILEENDIGSGEENWISVILSEPQSGKIKVGTYNLISEKKVSKDDFTINELKIIDENYQEISIDEEKDKDKDVNKVDNKNYLGIKVGICAIIILIILCFVYRKYRRDIRRKEEI